MGNCVEEDGWPHPRSNNEWLGTELPSIPERIAEDGVPSPRHHRMRKHEHLVLEEGGQRLSAFSSGVPIRKFHQPGGNCVVLESLCTGLHLEPIKSKNQRSGHSHFQFRPRVFCPPDLCQRGPAPCQLISLPGPTPLCGADRYVRIMKGTISPSPRSCKESQY